VDCFAAALFALILANALFFETGLEFVTKFGNTCLPKEFNTFEQFDFKRNLNHLFHQASKASTSTVSSESSRRSRRLS
jgi:hypothetical protein